jgi:hypothetical protein
MWKTGSEKLTDKGNLANKIPMGIPNLRQVLFKTHFTVILKELRNWKQIEMQIWNQSNILENNALVHPNGAMRNNITSWLIPECDVFLTNHEVEAREPLDLPVMWREQSESMSHVFSRLPSCINSKTRGERMVQYWGK